MGRYGVLVIQLLDDSVRRVAGNEYRIHNDVLSVYTRSLGEPNLDVRSFPMGDIKSYHWEDR